MNKKMGIDLTKGNILKQLLYFVIPVLIGNILSGGYSIINVVWIGKMLDKNALASIGVCMPIIGITIAIANSFSNAVTIMISKLFGSNDDESFKKAISSSWMISGIVILIITLSGIIFSKELLKLLNTPDSILPQATMFLKFQFLGYIFFHLTQNIFSLLRGIGITTASTVILIVGVIIYGVLDPVLINMAGLKGSAYAYVISISISCFIGIGYLMYKKSFLLPKIKHILDSFKMASELFKLAIPLFMQQFFVVLSTVFITAFVNHFGVSATAAYAIVSKIDTIIAMLATPLLVGMSAFTAQNHGSGNLERVQKSLKYGNMLNVLFVAPIWIFVLVTPKFIMGIFTENIEIITIGSEYLRVVGTGYILFAFMYVSIGTINGLGKTNVTMIITFISLCLIRIPLSGMVYQAGIALHWIWVVILCSLLVTTISTWVYLKRNLLNVILYVNLESRT